MPDREKIINGLNEITHYDGEQMFYNDIFIRGIADDALALLKEQEEKNGEWITIWRKDDPDTSTQARCSICNRISERPLGRYCKWCGAKMSQEWGVDG